MSCCLIINLLYQAFINTRYRYALLPYINNRWRLKEFKDELKTEITITCKQLNYVTGSSCVSAPPSDHVGSHCDIAVRAERISLPYIYVWLSYPREV